MNQVELYAFGALRFERTDQPARADLEAISDALFEFNCQTTQTNDFREFAVFLRDEQQEIVGGAAGWSRWDWLHISTLWICETYTGRGLGSRMLSQVEALARERGCQMIDLSTFSFQAPAFYRKHGFVELFAMDIPSRGIKKHFLQKLLDKI